MGERERRDHCHKLSQQGLQMLHRLEGTEVLPPWERNYIAGGPWLSRRLADQPAQPVSLAWPGDPPACPARPAQLAQPAQLAIYLGEDIVVTSMQSCMYVRACASTRVRTRVCVCVCTYVITHLCV